MDIQRVRNLITGILHTKMQHIYEDIEFIVGECFMKHMFPNALKAMTPWLKVKIVDARFWDDAFDITHIGDIDLEPMSKEEKLEFWSAYKELPSLLCENKKCQ